MVDCGGSAVKKEDSRMYEESTTNFFAEVCRTRVITQISKTKSCRELEKSNWTVVQRENGR